MRLFKTEVLSQNEIERIDETALTILEDVGFKIYGEKIINILREGGAICNENGYIKFPRKLVRDRLSKVPNKISWYDRNGNLSAILGENKSYVAMGHNAVYMDDIDTGERRNATTKDVRDLAILADRLEQIDVLAIPVDPWDVTPLLHVMYGVKILMENSTKPIYFSSNMPVVNIAIYEIAKEVYKNDLTKKPYIITQHSPTSPFVIEKEMAESLYEMAIRGIPISILPEPYNGVSAPYTVAGLLASCTAEILCGIVMAQIFNPGVACLFGSSWTTFDMRHAAAIIGSPETNLLRIAHAQMAKYYNIPSQVTSPNTEANAHDEQMGWEKMISQYSCMTSGNDLVVNCGMYSTGLAFSLEQLLLDDEMVGIIRRMIQGISINDDTLGLDVIKKVGPGGNFLMEEHTLNYLRTDEYYLYKVASVDPYETWRSKGKPTVVDYAKEHARKIISLGVKEPLNYEIQNNIDKIAAKYEDECKNLKYE